MGRQRQQYAVSIGLVFIVAAACFGLSSLVGYRVIAFILLLTVSVIAISFDIYPVLAAATLSAFIWDFFFIPPRFNLQVNNTEDAILLIMYFLIAMVNAVLTYKIRQVETASRKKEERANTLKLYDTLLNSLSHELRTPIATIIAATDNIQANNDNLTKENKDELLTAIARASFRLNEQVENLLSMSRLESGFIKPKFDWCDINELVYDIVTRLEENKISQPIEVDIPASMPLVKTDKLLVQQVLYNLLNNATLYTPPGSPITIKAAAHNRSLQLTVQDNGNGFPSEQIEKVFDKFYRLDHAKTGGTGLGLSIVKGFVEALKGQVKLENIPGGGAQFTITIPCEISELKQLS